MINDAERREVARMLRELGKVVYSPDNTYELMAGALGVDDFEGTDELFNRLADLIEPGAQCPYYHSDRHRCSAYDYAVDREALLALADDMDSAGEDGLLVRDSDLMAWTHRIRKALGVEQ